MLGIGQFAQLAKVSVRTLRYYGDHDLLQPVHVDPSSGYRSYNASQLVDLNRILVMKDLGLSLDEIKTFLADDIGLEDLITLAKQRQVQAEDQIEQEQQRLNRVATRIQLLKGTTMTLTTSAVVIKPLDPMRLATCSETVSGFDADLSAVAGRLFPMLYAELERHDVLSDLPTVMLYEQLDDGVEVTAGMQIGADVEFASALVQRRDLPAAERAATLVHTGVMADIHASHQVLLSWIDSAGEQPIELTRELYLDCEGPQESWVTEIQSVLA